MTADQVPAGRPHLTHPWIELNDAVEAGAEARGQDALSGKLKALAEETDSVTNWAGVKAEYQAAWSAIDQAADAVPADVRSEPATIARVVLVLTKQAALEYDEAIDGQRFVADHEYQDGRGFVLAARDYLKEQSASLKKVDADAYRDVMQSLESLSAAWPSAIPPKTPALQPGDVYANQSRLELSLSDFL
ncbi:hypothetical protein [Tamilnaduibacter salinus]|uniref:hypothetical protein n=1 Tax=Tamilnaduibacter salinus TaxID=1484056 RepID=UPI001402FC85|nr:hypothetical protein [Tamilnaduibacter salinus]